jgi:hypothetical protein
MTFSATSSWNTRFATWTISSSEWIWDVRWPNLYLFLQFNYAQSFFTSNLTTKPDFRLTPGLAYQNEYCQVSVGAQVALNHAAANGDRLAGLGLIEVFYDNIFPALGWQPF